MGYTYILPHLMKNLFTCLCGWEITVIASKQVMNLLKCFQL